VKVRPNTPAEHHSALCALVRLACGRLQRFAVLRAVDALRVVLDLCEALERAAPALVRRIQPDSLADAGALLRGVDAVGVLRRKRHDSRAGLHCGTNAKKYDRFNFHFLVLKKRFGEMLTSRLEVPVCMGSDSDGFILLEKGDKDGQWLAEWQPNKYPVNKHGASVWRAHNEDKMGCLQDIVSTLNKQSGRREGSCVALTLDGWASIDEVKAVLEAEVQRLLRQAEEYVPTEKDLINDQFDQLWYEDLRMEYLLEQVGAGGHYQLVKQFMNKNGLLFP
jgi:hypothetical protein